MVWIPLALAGLAGAHSLLTQMAIIRELELMLAGNEIFLGITLACWVLGTSMGAIGFSKLRNLFPAYSSHLTETLPGLALLSLPVSLWMCKYAQWLLHHSTFEKGLFALLFLGIFIVLPVAVLNGLWYAGILLQAQQSIEPNSNKNLFPAIAGWIFSCEALGATLAGLIYTFVLAHHWRPFYISFSWLLFSLLFLQFLNIFIFAKQPVLTQKTPPAVPANTLASLGARCWAKFWPISILVVILPFFPAGLAKDMHSVDWMHLPGNSLVQAYTAKGHILLLENQGLYSLYYSGQYQYSFPDILNNQPLVLIPLALFPQSRRIAMVGNNPEVVRTLTRVSSLAQIDLFLEDAAADEAFIRRLPPIWHQAYTSSKLRIVPKDFRQWLRETPDRYDIILMALAPPTTLSLNRFYTLEFMHLAQQHLNPQGLLLYSLPFSPNRLSPSETLLLGTLWHSLQAVFPQLIALPTESLFLLASNQNPLNELNPDILVRRYSQSPLLTLTRIPPEQFSLWFDPQRSASIKKALIQSHPWLNTDAHPISAGLHSFFWLSVHSRTLTWFTILVLAACLFSYLKYFYNRTKPEPGLWLMTAAGMAAITLELYVITAYQSIRGNLWETLGLFFAWYMLGTSIGSMLSPFVRVAHRMEVLAGILAVAVSLAYSGVLFSSHPELTAGALLLLAGVLAGLIYSGLSYKSSPEMATRIWAADLIGSCIGAGSAQIMLLPLFGPWAGGVAAILLILTAVFYSTRPAGAG